MPPHRRNRIDRGLRVFGYGRWDERAQAHAASTDGQMSLRATAAFSSDTFRSEGHTFLEALREVAAPALVIVGDLDGITGVKAGYDHRRHARQRHRRRDPRRRPLPVGRHPRGVPRRVVSVPGRSAASSSAVVAGSAAYGW